MKKGDKILCKKSYQEGDSQGGVLEVIAGKYYSIWMLDNYFKYVHLNYSEHQIITFSLSKRTYPPQSDYIWDYFYTLQETRKLKLKYLNEKG